MSKAYIITSGCYSDYSIEAVFLSKEQAKAFLIEKAEIDSDYSWGSDGRIEEYEIGKDYTLDGKEIYLVTYNSDSGKWNVQPSDQYVCMNSNSIVRSERLKTQKVSEARWTYRNYLVTDRGPDVALKAAQDQFYEIKARRLEYGEV